MNIGLFFGSFNPIHTGHLIIANTVLNTFALDKVWFVVSPQNPLKERSELLDPQFRFLLVKKAIAEDTRLEACNVEFNLPSPSYTIDTLTYLENLYPENQFYLILGSDAFESLPQWKTYEQLLEKKLIVYLRPGYPVSQKSIPDNISVLNSPLIEISSTEIRKLIKEKKSIRYLTPQPVIEAIEKNHFYM
jgi:nicotinate-nucleotide adenylyltransferase